MKEKIYLFAYGTLRRGLESPVKEAIERQLSYVGEGLVTARLYDLGAYPAAIKGSGTEVVTGDVFDVTNVDTTFQLLDEYEGDEYIRELVDVKLKNGETVKAWIYWYNKDLDETMRIEETDYGVYLKTKDSLR